MNRVRVASSLAATLLHWLFDHPQKRMLAPAKPVSTPVPIARIIT